jgi:hypothetical protein
MRRVLQIFGSVRRHCGSQARPRETAEDGLPDQPDKTVAVEVLNADSFAVARVGLTVSVDFLPT